MTNKLSTWMLLICVILLGSFIWFFERDSETSRQRTARSRTVFAVHPQQIERILLERDDVQIECTKQKGKWRLTRPSEAPVNESIVAKMIAGMARVERGEIISAEELKSRGLTPADYGFDEPRAKITFQNNLGTFTWLIGRDATLGETLYIMSTDGEDIISAPQTLLHLIPTDPAWIRDRTLFAGEVAGVRGLDLRRTAGFLQLRQPENNGWLIQQPYAGRADRVAVHALIEKLLDAKIQTFTTDEKTDLTVYGLEEPAYEIALFMQDEKVQTLRVGKVLPDNPKLRYAKWVENDSVFTVPEEWTAGLETDAKDLRSRLVLGVPEERISALKISRGEQTVELIKTNRQWTVARPVRWETEPSRTEEVLKALTQASVTAFVDSPAPAQTEQLQNALWEIQVTAGDKTHILKVSKPDGGGLRLVRHDDETALYQTDEAIVREAFADPLFYRNLTALEIDPSLIKSISIKSGDVEWAVEKNEEGAFVSSDPLRQASNRALTDLMWELNQLQAEEYIAFNPDSLKPYGLHKPQTVLTVTLDGTEQIGRILLLGSQTENGRYAMLQGQNIVFLLSSETVGILTRELTQAIEKTAPETTP